VANLARAVGLAQKVQENPARLAAAEAMVAMITMAGMVAGGHRQAGTVTGRRSKIGAAQALLVVANPLRAKDKRVERDQRAARVLPLLVMVKEGIGSGSVDGQAAPEDGIRMVGRAVSVRAVVLPLLLLLANLANLEAAVRESRARAAAVALVHPAVEAEARTSTPEGNGMTMVTNLPAMSALPVSKKVRSAGRDLKRAAAKHMTLSFATVPEKVTVV